MKAVAMMSILMVLIAGCLDKREQQYGYIRFSLEPFEKKPGKYFRNTAEKLVLHAKMTDSNTHKETFFRSFGVTDEEYRKFSNAWYDYWVTDVDKFSLVQIYDKKHVNNALKSQYKNIKPEHRLVLIQEFYLRNGWIGEKELQSIPIEVDCPSLPKAKYASILQPTGRCNFRKIGARLKHKSGDEFIFDIYGYYEHDDDNKALDVVIERVYESNVSFR